MCKWEVSVVSLTVDSVSTTPSERSTLLLVLWYRSHEITEGLNPRSIVSLAVSHQQPLAKPQLRHNIHHPEKSQLQLHLHLRPDIHHPAKSQFHHETKKLNEHPSLASRQSTPPGPRDARHASLAKPTSARASPYNAPPWIP